MINRGIATFTLDYGKCPRWLFEKMVRLGREVIEVIVAEEGCDAFIRRLGDPVWFQSLGTLLAFDWNASGLTTVLTAALKEAIRGEEKNLGIFICGGKGKTSRKTPDEIRNWGEVLSLPGPYVNNLVYNSKMSAKVDSSLVQDGFSIYHHAFFFTKNGTWTVVQQGMNIENQTARRYHWCGDSIKDFVCCPHSGIVSEIRVPTLNLVAKESEHTRKTSTELILSGYFSLMKDIQILRRHSSEIHKMLSLKLGDERLTLLKLEGVEFRHHPVLLEDFSKSKYLERILYKLCDEKPKNYEGILASEGVGPKTMRALALVSEVIYGAKPSYEDPARYSFAHGGKDRTPFPIDRKTYDKTINFFKNLTLKMKIPYSEKREILKKL